MRYTHATFADPSMAEKAAGALLDYGVKAEHISIIFPESYRSEDAANEADKTEWAAKAGISTTTPADAARGSIKGAELGFIAGTAAALAAVFLPGIGLVLGGGALAIALGGVAGSTAAGALAGGVTGYLKDQGVPPETIERDMNVLTSGGAMINIMPLDEEISDTQVEAILAKYGGTFYTNTPPVIVAGR